MPDTHVGFVLSLDGFWKVDAKYGRQFLAEYFTETLSATVYGIEKYLGSGIVRRIYRSIIMWIRWRIFKY